LERDNIASIEGKTMKSDADHLPAKQQCSFLISFLAKAV
jgi:hypothetical protein